MHHILITRTRRNITFFSTFLSGYPITKAEFRTAGKTGKREEAEGRAGPNRYVMTYIPLAESPQKETEPWFS